LAPVAEYRAKLLVDGNPLLTIDGHDFLFNPMTEAEGEPTAVADTLFVLEPASLTTGSGVSALAWELECGIRYFERPQSALYCSSSFKRHLAQRGQTVTPGTRDEQTWRRFHRGLAERVHAIDPARVLDRGEVLVSFVRNAAAGAEATPGETLAVRLSTARCEAMWLDASACSGARIETDSLDLLVVSRASSVPEEAVLQLLATLKPRAVLFAHDPFGKKRRVSLTARLASALPGTEVLSGR
jgi:hypothetical protein